MGLSSKLVLQSVRGPKLLGILPTQNQRAISGRRQEENAMPDIRVPTCATQSLKQQLASHKYGRFGVFMYLVLKSVFFNG